MNNDLDQSTGPAMVEEFGEVPDAIAFLQQNQPDLYAAFLNVRELAIVDGALSRKHKLLMQAAIMAAQHDRAATTMHLISARAAGATRQELLETAYTLIPVAGMPALGVFIRAWQKAILR
jgi:alkylhydroperoxidase/carboxymuconolactone decarboxylase family protein YurZ